MLFNFLVVVLSHMFIHVEKRMRWLKGRTNLRSGNGTIENVLDLC